jgi:hypothetical protein
MKIRALCARLCVSAAVVTMLVAVAPASAFRLQGLLAPVAGNPVEKLASLPADAPAYDRATGCKNKAQPGMLAFKRWLERHARGQAWGIYRCERWGKRSASLHAEGRALDWHLDVGRPADRKAARRLITLLLAPDSAGTPHALARRMGLEEVIWDCSYWGAGMEEFRPYSECFNKHGKPRRRVDPTIAHRNHIHFGMTKRGAAGLTSFWRFLKLGSVGRVREVMGDELSAEQPDEDPFLEDESPEEPESGEDDVDDLVEDVQGLLAPDRRALRRDAAAR